MTLRFCDVLATLIGKAQRSLRGSQYPWGHPSNQIPVESCFDDIFIIGVKMSPLTPVSDQGRISPYDINTISSRRMMRIKKNIN